MIKRLKIGPGKDGIQENDMVLPGSNRGRRICDWKVWSSWGEAEEKGEANAGVDGEEEPTPEREVGPPASPEIFPEE